MGRDTKQRMVAAAASSIRRRGLVATSFTDVLTATGAARGAIYHHFPGGKDQLAVDAVTWTGRRVRDHLGELRGADAEVLLQNFIEHVRPIVAQAAAGAGCAVAAAAAEATDKQPAVSVAAGQALTSWVDVLAARFGDAGIAAAQARSTAQLLIIFLEGSLVMARATGDTGAFETAAGALITSRAGLGPPATPAPPAPPA